MSHTSFKFDAGGVFIFALLAIFLSNLFFPFLLMGLNNDMELRIGNPKAVYFYDVCPSCNNVEKESVESSLNYLSSVSGIIFVQVPPPIALLIGGIEYSCGGVTTPQAAGESESGVFSIVVWNNVRLSDTSDVVVLHETLHSLGFGHSRDPNNIMYPYSHSGQHVDTNTISVLEKYYTSNPFGYLNIITLNMLVTGFCLFIIIGLLWGLLK